MKQPRVRPILDLQGTSPAVHALRALSSASTREGTLWTFLGSTGSFPKDAHLYFELPVARAGAIVRRLLAVPSRSRVSFVRLILQVSSSSLREVDESQVQALRATGIRLALHAPHDLAADRRLDRFHPDYVRFRAQWLGGNRDVRLETVTRKAWDLGAAVLLSEVHQSNELETALHHEVRFAEGSLFGPPVRVGQLTNGESHPWALPQPHASFDRARRGRTR